MDASEYGPNALVPTPQVILERYQGIRDNWGPFKEKLFSLPDAYGAAKRKLLFEEELTAETFNRFNRVNSISMTNIGDMYILMTAIKLASHVILK